MILEYRDVVKALSEEAGLSRREAARTIQAFASLFQRNLIAGNELKIRNIGRFRRGVVAPGKRVTPTGEKVTRPSNVVYFKPAKTLRKKMRRFDYERGRKQTGNSRRGQGHERVLSKGTRRQA